MQKGASLTFFHPDNELNFGCSLPLRGKVALDVYTRTLEEIHERKKERRYKKSVENTVNGCWPCHNKHSSYLLYML